MNKLLALLMLLICSAAGAQNISSMDPSQVYNTSNLVTFNQNGSQTTSPWQNVGQWGGQLQCWAPGMPGYCGPQPYVNANGQGVINFSYGYTDLYQLVNIAAALPNSGTGLRVNGFNFGFTAKNGNGWDNGQQDYLVAYVNFYDAQGGIAQSYNYGSQTNRKYDWTNFYFSETFATPYASKDLSTARYGFVGYDTNFWAGPYGPEIQNVSFSLKYSVDPCATNPLYSPSCPGYMDALNKLLPSSSTGSNVTVSSSSTTPTSTVSIETVLDPVQPIVTVTSTPVYTSTTNSLATTGTAGATSSVTATSNNTASKESSSSGGTSLGLSVVSKNQQREQSIAAQAVQTATSTAAAAAVASQQEAAAVAAQAVTNSITSAATGGSSQQMFLGSGLRVGASSAQSLVPTMAPAAQPSSVVSISVGPTSNTTTQTVSTLSTAVDTTPVLGSNILLDRTNPLNQVLEQTPVFTQTTAATTSGSTVNRNTTDNEAAGGVNIARIAIAPVGYNDYLNLTLRDAAFYAPREVYKNQRTVDNARALRQLTNDSRHQEMIEQQYRR